MIEQRRHFCEIQAYTCTHTNSSLSIEREREKKKYCIYIYISKEKQSNAITPNELGNIHDNDGIL